MSLEPECRRTPGNLPDGKVPMPATMRGGLMGLRLDLPRRQGFLSTGRRTVIRHRRLTPGA